MTSSAPLSMHQDRPFSTTVSPRYFYLAPQYKVALNHAIATVVEKDGLAIVAGPIGSGKSSLFRYLVDWLNDALLETLSLAIIYNPSYSTDFQLLKAVCAEFGIGPKLRRDEQMVEFRAFLHQQSEAGKTVVLLLDEAHKLTASQFELIREFFNFSHNESFHLQVILAGETEPLHHKLKNKQAVRSRAMFYDILAPLSIAETAELIRFRLKVADLPEDLFDDEAMALVHEVSGGIPRVIVKIGRHVFPLVREDNATVTRELIQSVLDTSPEVFRHD